jgi:sn-glycerol 3-phosphate transport system ATP-binding protein
LLQELRREIRALQQRLGITMIYVTHDQTEAMSMADRVVLMKGGRIEQNGRPADLYQRPASLFAARFIGSAPMNFLDLDDGPQGVTAVIAGTAGPALFAASGRGRVLGLRPEDVTVETAANRARFRSAVTAVEYLGGEALVTCVIAGRPIVARTRGDAALAVGTEVGLAWDEAAGHVFDANTGQRLALATFDAAASVQRHAIANQGVP